MVEMGEPLLTYPKIQKYKKLQGSRAQPPAIAVASGPPAALLRAIAVGCASLVRLLKARLIAWNRAMALPGLRPTFQGTGLKLVPPKLTSGLILLLVRPIRRPPLAPS